MSNHKSSRIHLSKYVAQVPFGQNIHNPCKKVFSKFHDVSLPTNQMENEQEAIKLPIGPITRARAKRFKVAILALVERIEENESKELKDELNIFNFFEVEIRSS